MSSLDKKIAQRKRKAENKEIYETAVTIARFMGKAENISEIIDGDTTNVDWRKGVQWGYQSESSSGKKSLRIELKAVEEYLGSNDASINVYVAIYNGNDKVFYKKNDCIESYIPGAWEKKINLSIQ